LPVGLAAAELSFAAAAGASADGLAAAPPGSADGIAGGVNPNIGGLG
jgi:hypothetical protein